MNDHYTKRYNKFIDSIKTKNTTRKLEFSHKHHIIPKSLGGSDDLSNILVCSPREHYICHLMLAKSTETKEMIYAWNFLRNEAKSSRYFESLLIEKYKLMSDRLKGKVSITNLETGESYFEDINTAKNMIDTGLYKYCGSGYTIVKDSLGNPYSVSVNFYRENKDNLIHINSGKFSVFDKITGKNKKISADEFDHTRHITNLTGVTTIKTKTGNKKISTDEYNSGNYDHINKNLVIVKNKKGETLRINKKDMTDEFVSIKMGKVNVYFEDGTSGEITKEEFHKNRHLYKSHNEGLVTVFDIKTGKTIQVTKNEYKQYKDIKYKHPTKGLSLTCPHCGKTGGNTMKRWHFDNCKNKGK